MSPPMAGWDLGTRAPSTRWGSSWWAASTLVALACGVTSAQGAAPPRALSLERARTILLDHEIQKRRGIESLLRGAATPLPPGTPIAPAPLEREADFRQALLLLLEPLAQAPSAIAGPGEAIAPILLSDPTPARVRTLAQHVDSTVSEALHFDAPALLAQRLQRATIELQALSAPALAQWAGTQLNEARLTAQQDAIIERILQATQGAAPLDPMQDTALARELSRWSAAEEAASRWNLRDLHTQAAQIADFEVPRARWLAWQDAALRLAAEFPDLELDALAFRKLALAQLETLPHSSFTRQWARTLQETLARTPPAQTGIALRAAFRAPLVVELGDAVSALHPVVISQALSGAQRTQESRATAPDAGGGPTQAQTLSARAEARFDRERLEALQSWFSLAGRLGLLGALAPADLSAEHLSARLAPDLQPLWRELRHAVARDQVGMLQQRELREGLARLPAASGPAIEAARTRLLADALARARIQSLAVESRIRAATDLSDLCPALHASGFAESVARQEPGALPELAQELESCISKPLRDRAYGHLVTLYMAPGAVPFALLVAGWVIKPLRPFSSALNAALAPMMKPYMHGMLGVVSLDTALQAQTLWKRRRTHQELEANLESQTHPDWVRTSDAAQAETRWNQSARHLAFKTALDTLLMYAPATLGVLRSARASAQERWNPFPENIEDPLLEWEAGR